MMLSHRAQSKEQEVNLATLAPHVPDLRRK